MMQRFRHALIVQLVPCLGALLLLGTGTSHAIAGPAEDYIDHQLRVVQSLENQLDGIISAADQSAAHLLAGGRIYLAGERGMVSELLGRAGGLCGAKMLDLDKSLPALSDKDVVILSDYGLPRERAAPRAASG
jgi:hypothetical protein